MRNYRRVTYEDRCQIQIYLQVGTRISELASQLGFHKSTIYREIQRNSPKGRRYSSCVAQPLARRRQKLCCRKRLITGKIERIIRYKIRKEQWSPQEISNRARREKAFQISAQTIYRFIYRHWEELKVFLRRRRKRGAGRYCQRRTQIAQNKRWIDHRPKIANERRRIGDWERDTFFLAKQKDQILVCVDRKSRLLKISRSDYRIKPTSALTWRLITSSGRKPLTITNDNGPEFRDGVNMKVPVYYCNPQKPQQRGTVENTIGLLRQYIRQDTASEAIPNRYLKQLEKKLNMRPRRCLDYRTPYEVFYGKSVALVM